MAATPPAPRAASAADLSFDANNHLAANYLLKRLEAIGCQAAYPERRASHEFILTFAKQAKDNHVTALDIAKRLLDYNQHAPTIYFPLLVPECFLIDG